MAIPEIKFCPGTLAEGFDTYSPTARKKVFGGKKLSHILPYSAPGHDEHEQELFIENRKRISISGVQEKMSLILEKNSLRLTKPGEQGSYILKPIPRDVKKADQVPANEHLTMQIANQVYGITTAENALIFFDNGDPAYITKRFDLRPDLIRNDGFPAKWGTEDFASLAGKSRDISGSDFKYRYTYEEIGELIIKYIPAYRVEVEKYFKQIVFNFLFCNGDAHLKNFSVLESPAGDYFLSPAYDLINTRIHIRDSPLALKEGLFKDGFQSRIMDLEDHLGLEDFREFAYRLGINERRIEKTLNRFLEYQDQVEDFIERSYLSETTKEEYLKLYQERLEWLNSI